MQQVVTPTGQRKSRHSNGLECLTANNLPTRFSAVQHRMSNLFPPPASEPKADLALGIVTIFLRTHRVMHRRISMGYGGSADFPPPPRSMRKAE